MQSLLAAVGLRRQEPASSLPWPSEADVLTSGALLPDFVAVASATEQAIVKLEDEARSLESASLQDAILLLRRWSQSLRRRPRPDEPLASFRAQFLRSNVLERSLQALRRNEYLQKLMLDVFIADTTSHTVALPGTSFTDRSGNSSDEKFRPEDLVSEVCNVLQLCLPRSAAPLVQPLLRTTIDDVPMEFVTEAFAAVRKLKEDWVEVVRCQATRGLERKLDSLDYELQKLTVAQTSAKNGFKASDSQVGDMDPAGALLPPQGVWQASHDHVAVLATLCEALSASRSQAENRASEVSATLRVLGGASTGMCSSSSFPAGPSKADCEAAIAAMVRRNMPGMQQGLRLLGLPDDPLIFVPGSQLRLCGCDIRDSINDMMVHWVEEDMDSFHKVLHQIKLTVLSSGDGNMLPRANSASTSLPPEDDWHIPSESDSCEDIDATEAASFVPADRPHPVSLHHTGSTSKLQQQSTMLTTEELNPKAAEKPALLARRAAITAERQQLLDRVSALDQELKTIDDELKASRVTVRGAASRSEVAFTGAMDATLIEASCALDPNPPARKAAAAWSPTEPQWLPSSTKSLIQEFRGGLIHISEAVAVESERVADRLRGQQHQRRSQLLTGLASYLEYEVTHVSRMKLIATSNSGVVIPPVSGSHASAMAAAEAVQASWRRVRTLCKRVENVATADGCAQGHAVRLWPEVVTAGMRCRAKWMDGSHYDAEVQCLLGDGTVLVNWLRPQIEDTYTPLVTVSESGGDDTCHRIVSRDDIQLVGTGRLRDPPENVQAAQALFRTRSEADLVCVDCGGGQTTWASISFGTYLCNTCAEEHCQLGLRVSLVRRLDDGWGWPKHDLEPLRIGGNNAFRSDEAYPAVRGMPLPQRYTSRFAEHYRKQLDARCSNCAPPPSLNSEMATSPVTTEFLTMLEGIALAKQSIHHFEAVARSAQEALPTVLPRSNTDQGRFSAHRSHGYESTDRSCTAGGLLVVQGCGVEPTTGTSPCTVRPSLERRFISTQ